MSRHPPYDPAVELEAETLAEAAALMAGLMQEPGLDDPALKWVVRPADAFSGDAVAARRTPSGRLLAMLADATGHGLSAAGNLLPALRVFYAQARQDRPIGAVAREINRCLQSAGRTGRFVAAVMIDIAADGKGAAVWNGGMPAGLWLREQREIAALPPQHPPLGILPDWQFDSACTRLDAAAGGHLLFFSDGLPEAVGPAGEAFGIQRVREHALAGPAVDAAARVQSAVHSHLRGAPAGDDMSMLTIDLAGDARTRPCL